MVEEVEQNAQMNHRTAIMSGEWCREEGVWCTRGKYAHSQSQSTDTYIHTVQYIV